MFGGHYTSLNGGQNKVEYYDYKNDKWVAGPNLNNPRGVSTAVTGPVIA